MPTRSTKFASITPAAGPAFSVLTVPAGLTYLFKSVFVHNNGAVADNASAYLQDASGNFGAMFVNRSLGADANGEWEGFIAGNPGDQLFVHSVQGTSVFWISGAKLVGVA